MSIWKCKEVKPMAKGNGPNSITGTNDKTNVSECACFIASFEDVAKKLY